MKRVIKVLIASILAMGLMFMALVEVNQAASQDRIGSLASLNVLLALVLIAELIIAVIIWAYKQAKKAKIATTKTTKSKKQKTTKTTKTTNF